MRVRVLFFGVLKDLLPNESQTLELPPGSTVEALIRYYRQFGMERPEMGRVDTGVWSALAVAVNREYASPARTLEDGDEVALLPPVSGGSGAGAGRGIHGRIALVREPIDRAAVMTDIRQTADGAVVVFDGVVRDNTRGRQTLYLDYEAYEEMALDLMRGLACEAVNTWGVREVVIVHRLGRLQVGETSVIIAVASAHRAQAFDACRWLIDTLKKTVPIWKKEYFADGAVWAPGEAFPPEIAGKGIL